ncbi:IST1 -like protein [Trichinella murrelli]|uniref:IST1 homolog n=1 Tax=Trichinella murrelli TaxID=144512 RepID=A0A0V0UBJ4_9BILA|nr:IST1 -like protein [Trichinella murrelli]
MSTKMDCINIKTYVENAMTRLEQLEKRWCQNIQQQKSNSEGNVLKKDFKGLPHCIENLAFMEHAIQVFQIVNVLCKMFLRKVDLIQNTSREDLQGDLEELVINFLWVCPRLSCFAPEFAVVCEYFIIIYGKDFAEICFENRSLKVHPALLRIINNTAMVEKIMEHFKYFMEFAKRNKVEVDPVKQRGAFKFRSQTLSVLSKAEMQAAKKWKTYIPVIHLCQCESAEDFDKQQICSSKNGNASQDSQLESTVIDLGITKEQENIKHQTAFSGDKEEATTFAFKVTAFEKSLPVNLRSAVYSVHSISTLEHNRLVLLKFVDKVSSKTKSEISAKELVELIKHL